jgi:hypothetical protein
MHIMCMELGIVKQVTLEPIIEMGMGLVQPYLRKLIIETDKGTIRIDLQGANKEDLQVVAQSEETV